LHLAIYHGQMSIVQYYIDVCDADITCTTNDGQNVFDIALVAHDRLNNPDITFTAMDGIRNVNVTCKPCHDWNNDFVVYFLQVLQKKKKQYNSKLKRNRE
jgi:hypothetical protein